jgi:carboxymethylenebutenolidase
MSDKIDIQELIHLYWDGAFNRRELVRRASRLTGGATAAAAALTAMGAFENIAKAQDACSAESVRVPEDADDLVVQNVEFPGDASTLFGHLAQPKRDSTDPIPAVLVIHENRGLNDHIKDVTRRVARAGFLSLGIDLLSRQGGTSMFPDPADAMRVYNATTADGRLADMRRGVAYLRTLANVRGNRIGSVGFCAGGGNVWALAVSGEQMAAYVVYYGQPPADSDLPNLSAPILLHYAELDPTLSARVPLAALLQMRKKLGFHVYEGAMHAFNNDTGPAYNPTAACDAWSKTIDFFTRYLNAAD